MPKWFWGILTYGLIANAFSLAEETEALRLLEKDTTGSDGEHWK